ncbi:MAG: hypothetical protein CME65_03590 [Halobacteriovoraceae bacterium]|nr:hypothetical protein [Halobacteriovoraceae bacterium]|tara:strand:- start:796 stop:1650 length:855 start_codon:yes stop_codon:yes gene_type:complete
MTKLILLSLCLSTTALANQKTWIPKYQQKSKQTKTVEKKVVDSLTKEPKTEPVAKRNIVKPETPLEALYLKVPRGKQHLELLKAESLKLKQDAVPTLIKVMKSSDYPDQNRWIATYMLGRIMGKKSAPFISKFTKHPNWMLRLAALKVLLHLDQKQYDGIYARLLEDKSLIVRHQALQNIKEMNLTKLAPYVWKMLYNKQNYVGVKGNRKRSHIVKTAIKVIGDLDFKDAKMPMLKMIQKKKYSDIHGELDYALSLINDEKSPDGNLSVKRIYWNKVALKEFKI